MSSNPRVLMIVRRVSPGGAAAPSLDPKSRSAYPPAARGARRCVLDDLEGGEVLGELLGELHLQVAGGVDEAVVCAGDEAGQPRKGQFGLGFERGKGLNGLVEHGRARGSGAWTIVEHRLRATTRRPPAAGSEMPSARPTHRTRKAARPPVPAAGRQQGSPAFQARIAGEVTLAVEQDRGNSAQGGRRIRRGHGDGAGASNLHRPGREEPPPTTVVPGGRRDRPPASRTGAIPPGRPAQQRVGEFPRRPGGGGVHQPLPYQAHPVRPRHTVVLAPANQHAQGRSAVFTSALVTPEREVNSLRRPRRHRWCTYPHEDQVWATPPRGTENSASPRNLRGRTADVLPLLPRWTHESASH